MWVVDSLPRDTYATASRWSGAAAARISAASFDVVSSAHGVVFAADHVAAARELARVCRSRGRLGLTAWRQGPGARPSLVSLSRSRRGDHPGRVPAIGVVRTTCASCSRTRSSCGPETWIQTGDSGEAIWQLLMTCSPPFKALADALDELPAVFVNG
jgi:hypothetical protein